jgi:hypothetical protein
VDIGGRRLHIVTDGDSSPVVTIPATADNVVQRLPIQRKAAASTTICVYDRAGIGFPVKSTR